MTSITITFDNAELGPYQWHLFSLEGLHHVLQNGMSGTQSLAKVRLARRWRLCKFVYQPFSTSYILLKFGRRIIIRQFSVTLLIWNRGMFEVIVHVTMCIRLTDQRTLNNTSSTKSRSLPATLASRIRPNPLNL